MPPRTAPGDSIADITISYRRVVNQQAFNYGSYLELEKILNAQHPRSDPEEHDEHLFIVIHQVYELWFKQLIHELDYLVELLSDGFTDRAGVVLSRMLKILKTVVAQIDVLETMTPLDFLSFRSFLEDASGFQSMQFREMEFALGYKRKQILDDLEGTPRSEALQRRYESPTLWDAFLELLAESGYPVDPRTDVTAPVEPDPAVQEVLLDMYRNNVKLRRVAENLVDLDEGLQEWRYRHVKMVERTIGRKIGTGGSEGVAYLQSTLKPFFPDLWEIRSRF
ncbi:MAG: tryptophan 2,3-dioxygenase [Acidimicrobiia bacterium]|nr:tryptophan 2,3-dioxygenase [Acidimicrobiia bacterium]